VRTLETPSNLNFIFIYFILTKCYLGKKEISPKKQKIKLSSVVYKEPTGYSPNKINLNLKKIIYKKKLKIKN
jgi:hypothetical protein